MLITMQMLATPMMVLRIDCREETAVGAAILPRRHRGCLSSFSEAQMRIYVNPVAILPDMTVGMVHHGFTNKIPTPSVLILTPVLMRAFWLRADQGVIYYFGVMLSTTSAQLA